MRKGKASTYPDEKTANEVVKEILRSNEKEIVDWMANDKVKKGLILEKEFKDKIGVGITKGEMELKEKYKAKLVIKCNRHYMI